MNIITCLRKNGIPVMFHPTEHDTLLVDGQKTYICMRRMWKRGEYDFKKPQHNRIAAEYIYCIAVFLDKPGVPIYLMNVTHSGTAPQVHADLTSKYPLKFLMFFDKRLKGGEHHG